ncbi:MAG: AAA family ATPase [Candidatus Omnitrophota bacterium]
MKHLPLGIQTFKRIIEENRVYVDKTETIFKLFSEGGRYYFLSRPRRFGKSLLVSTLKEIFQGNRELFKGLWIYDKITWEQYPVIHIDFSGLIYGSKEELIDTLNYFISEHSELYGIPLKDNTYDKKFRELVTKLSSKNKVVVLIDEYDKPIVDYFEKPEIAMENRDTLRNFFSTFKGLDEYIQFVLITGGSKFSNASLFSGLNNFTDITISNKYSTLLGFTDEELQCYFEDQINDFCKSENIQKEPLLQTIKKMYNGYSWDGINFVYNPHSILNLFDQKSFNNYWFTSATPTFLIKQIRKLPIPLEDIENYQADQTLFEFQDVDRISVYSLLFQTGYLTIKSIEKISLTSKLYHLSYPNMEVKESFLKHLSSE